MAERAIVVAAAILDATGERVLAARRTTPPETAGRWELPGGKVEPEETPEAALVREIGEELGCVVEVLDWLPGEAPIGESHVLRAATARLTAGEPRPREHDLLRWLTAEELDEVDWLAPDRPFLPHLADALTATSHAPRGIFFEEDDARSAAAQLRAEGWSADVVRERYHGEDDDEDHPWAVVTDAPLLVLELLVDEYDGWLDAPGDDGPDGSLAPEPLDLPTAPRRVKRPDR
ncbi:(deoxy)nucleoside triphosphate pyrophosphohydrolase [Nocardioides sp. DS6]|uniref:8-oxo-dGTP diphosphatase n=1 Tax=Nocardioides eburneus TaxID=3231482 RepID=A0ABV3SYG6_9ACTN